MIKENQRGFSLVELVVTAGIGSVVVLGLVTLMDSIGTQQGFLASRMDLSVLTEDLRQALKDPAICASVFGATLSLNPAEITQVSPRGQSIASLQLPNGELIRLTEPKLERYALIVSDLRLADGRAMGPTTYQANLEGAFRSAKGANQSFRRVNFGRINFAVNSARQIQACSFETGAGGPGGVLASAEQRCLGMGGYWISSTPTSGRCSFCGGFQGFEVFPDTLTGQTRIRAICAEEVAGGGGTPD